MWYGPRFRHSRTIVRCDEGADGAVGGGKEAGVSVTTADISSRRDGGGCDRFVGLCRSRRDGGDQPLGVLLPGKFACPCGGVRGGAVQQVAIARERGNA